MKLQLENSKISLNKKQDSMKMSEAEWDNKRMIKSDSYKILLKMKEERVWLMRKRSDSYKQFLKLKSEKLTTSIQNLMNFREKVSAMMNKLDSWGNKLKRREERVLPIKTRSKSFNTSWPKRWECFKTKMQEIQIFRMTLKVWEISWKKKERKVWLMKLQSES